MRATRIVATAMFVLRDDVSLHDAGKCLGAREVAIHRTFAFICDGCAPSISTILELSKCSRRNLRPDRAGKISGDTFSPVNRCNWERNSPRARLLGGGDSNPRYRVARKTPNESGGVFLTPPLYTNRQLTDYSLQSRLTTSCRRPASEALPRPSLPASPPPCIRWSAEAPRPRPHSEAPCERPWSGR